MTQKAKDFVDDCIIEFTNEGLLSEWLLDQGVNPEDWLETVSWQEKMDFFKDCVDNYSNGSQILMAFHQANGNLSDDTEENIQLFFNNKNHRSGIFFTENHKPSGGMKKS